MTGTVDLSALEIVHHVHRLPVAALAAPQGPPSGSR